MPTGYTAAVQDGKITTLQQFALQCARAFGALIYMRDDNMDAPIPEILPRGGEYRRERVLEDLARLAELERLSPIEAQRRCQAHNLREIQAWADYCDRNGIHAARYKTMIAQVEAWSPPTPDHVHLQTFMLDQLRISLQDCRSDYITYPQRLRWPEWLEKQRLLARGDIARYSQDDEVEQVRADSRQRWIDDLRQSLETQ